MAVLQGTDEHKHFAAVITLGVMIAGRAQNHLSDASTERAVQALLKEAQDSTSAGREEAIKGFLSVNNPEIRPVMERLAASDTTASLHAPGRPVRYGVRDAARAWLAAHPNALDPRTNLNDATLSASTVDRLPDRRRHGDRRPRASRCPPSPSKGARGDCDSRVSVVSEMDDVTFTARIRPDLAATMRPTGHPSDPLLSTRT